MDKRCCYTYSASTSPLSSGRDGGCTAPKLLNYKVGPKSCEGVCTYYITNLGMPISSDDPMYDNYSVNKEYVDSFAKGLVDEVTTETAADVEITQVLEKGRNYRIFYQVKYTSTTSGSPTIVADTPGITVTPASLKTSTKGVYTAATTDQLFVEYIVVGDGQEHTITGAFTVAGATPLLNNLQLLDVGKH